jgi:catechol 1,2-dioxygenase
MKRRSFIKNSALTAFSVAALGTIQWNGKSFVGDNVTTTDILGPYYRPGAPMRSDLIPKGSKGEVMHLVGTVLQKDGRTPLADATIEAWQCDENEVYDNTSDEYLFRGTVKTGKDGKYSFKTIVPVPYKVGETEWRPAHIHLRISSGSHQDLITQIYFKGDPHLAEDSGSASPNAVNRILEIGKNSKNEKMLKFDVVMGNAFPLDDASYKRICGLYTLENGAAEFYREDDLLFLKMNGWLREALVYKGNNTFEGGIGLVKATFELVADGSTKVAIHRADFSDFSKITKLEGVKFLKYPK